MLTRLCLSRYRYLSTNIQERLAQPSYTYLLWFDHERLFAKMNSRVERLPKNPPVAEKIEKDFYKQYDAKQKGI